MVKPEPSPEKRPPDGVDIVVEVPNSDDEEADVVAAVFPNSELFVAALCAVSPEGAKILVLLFTGCSELVPALRPEKRPPAVEAGVLEDWPKSDMMEATAGVVSAGSYVHRILCSSLPNRVENFQARPKEVLTILAFSYLPF